VNRVSVSRRLAREDGAIIVHVAMVGVILLGLSAFVVDYGVLLISRQQAQNAADAGAMAGAVARAYDDPNAPPSAGGIVEQSVAELVNANPVWSNPGQPAVDYSCPAGISFPCVRVDVFRDAVHGNPLPTFFGPVLGIMAQDVQATATAIVGPGNSTTCLKPWAIPDKWIEHRPVTKIWEASDVFNRYDEGSGAVLSPADEYIPPLLTGGMANTTELGLAVSMTFANPDASDPITPGFLLPVSLPGANTYAQNITSCNGQLVPLDAVLPTESLGVLPDTISGFSDLIAADPDANWDSATKSIRDSCAPGPCGAVSPRLVAMALFNVDQYQFTRATTPCPPGCTIRVSNIIGLFIESSSGIGAVGYVTKYPGQITEAAPVLSESSSFLPVIALVR
jgi:hypothetical protein